MGVRSQKRIKTPTLAGIAGLFLFFNISLGTAAIAQTAASHHGPKIMMVKPADTEAVFTPCDIRVRFDRRNSTPIDLSTLEVTVLKLWREIDITERVRPHATPEGITMTQVKLPRGKHTFRISIADIAGRVSAQILAFTVQ